jgi:hypothetical protein
LENLKKGGHLEDLGLDGRVILVMELKEIVLESVDWLHLAQD